MNVRSAFVTVARSAFVAVAMIAGLLRPAAPAAAHEASAPHTPPYTFRGFYPPVENFQVNHANPGSAVPLKFRLGGFHGMDVFLEHAPYSAGVDCANPASVDPESLEQVTGDLNYNAATDLYNFVWKTEKSWAGTCRTIVMVFNDHVTPGDPTSLTGIEPPSLFSALAGQLPIGRGAVFAFSVPAQATDSSEDLAPPSINVEDLEPVAIPAQGPVEYALIMVLVAIIVIGIMTLAENRLVQLHATICGRPNLPQSPTCPLFRRTN